MNLTVPKGKILTNRNGVHWRIRAENDLHR